MLAWSLPRCGRTYLRVAAGLFAGSGPRGSLRYCPVMGMTVELAGPLRLVHGDPTGVEVVVGSPKERRLLALLAVNRSRSVSTDMIVEALWGDRPPRQPAQNVASLVSRLRAALGSEVILGSQGVYQLGGPPAVQVDIDQAAQFVATAAQRLAEGFPALAGTAAARALAMLGNGLALAGEPDADWVQAVRGASAQLVRSARHAAAAAALETGEFEVARAAAADAVEADHFDEIACRLLMTAHHLAGEPAKAVEAYQRLRTELADELGVDPASQTGEVYLTVLRGEPPKLNRVAAPGPSTDAQLVGRATELHRTTAAWAAANRGEPGVLLLIGEAGIGKTRLAAEAAATAESTGGVVLSARCYAAERSLFLQPFVDALAGPLASLPPDRLRSLAGGRRATLAGLIPTVAETLGGFSATDQRRPDGELRQAYEAVTLVLRGLATTRPVLVVVDDLHNAGTATVGLLHYLARHAGTARLLILATLRTEEGAETAALLAPVTGRIEVGPLDAVAVARLAVQAGQGDVADAIMARTRGHPLFVVETLRGLVSGAPGIPESLRAAVLARLGRAGVDIEELLRAGSVLGATLDPAAVASLLELTQIEAARRCERAAETRLLVAVGRAYEFANDLVQEVLYATTPMPSRQLYHRRAADLPSNTPEVVARHAAAIEDWPRAARAYLLAGEQAARRGAVGDAEVLLSHALGAAERTGELALVGRVRVARARAREALECYQSALADLQVAVSAARQAGDRRLEMVALRELGGDVPLSFGVTIEDCVANLRAGLRIAESLGDRAAEADLLARLAVVASHRLSFTEALDCGRRAAAAGRAAGDERALLLGLDGAKTALAYLGELAELTEVVTELEPLARRQGDLFRLHWAVFEGAFPAIASADWKRARAGIEEAIEMSVQSGYVGHEPWLVAHLGWVARLQGQHDESTALGRRAVALSGRTAHRWWQPTAQALLATTLIEAGGTAEAIALLNDAVAQLGPDGNEAHRLRCFAALAQATNSRAVLDVADELLSGIVAPPGSAWLLGTDAYLSVARAWLHHDRPERARAVIAPLIHAARRQRWLPTLASSALVEGEAAAALGDRAGAHDAYAQALDLATRHAMVRVEQDARTALLALEQVGGRPATP